MAKFIKNAEFNDIVAEALFWETNEIFKEEEEAENRKAQSKGKRKTGKAQRRRDSYYAMRRKATRLSRFEPELDERKLRNVGKWAHAECHGWWTEKEAEDYRKALRGAFAKSELNIPEPEISRVKVYVH